MPDNPLHDGLDWKQLGELLGDAQVDVGYELVGPERNAQIARRFVTLARLASSQHVNSLVVMNGRRMQEQARRITAEAEQTRQRYGHALTTISDDLAAALRERADNRYFVSGIRRREGVLLAAEWLAGGSDPITIVPSDPPKTEES